jgi:hypothetical protein
MDISNFFGITNHGFANGLMKMDVTNMRSFSIGNFDKLSLSVFNDMITKMVGLTELIVVCSDNYLNDKFMQLIFKHLVNVKVLALEHTHDVSEKILFSKYPILNHSPFSDRSPKLDLVTNPSATPVPNVIVLIV